MRPVKLTMQAFGSYGKRTVIDFEKTNQNLFLITGDTGAGKSTIFDAIVFALYGEASSGINKKDGTELQSQYVGPETEPFVELVFSEATGAEKKTYTVRRVPRHFRPLKRGTGVKEESGSVSLIMPDDSEYPQKETDRKLEEIVGLTKNQFMQVAMIAQGEFMELLRAKSDDKKVIFRKLFHTELYGKIVEELGRRRKGKQQEMGQIRTVCQTEASHVEVPADYEKAEELLTLKKRIVSSDRLSVVDLEEMLAILEDLCSTLKERCSAAGKEYREANRLYLEKRDACTAGLQLLRRFQELEQAEQELEECKAQEKEIRETADQIRKISDAYEIQAVYERYMDAEKTVKAAERSLAEQEEALPGLSKMYEETKKQTEETNALLHKEIENYTKVSEKAERAMNVFQEIRKAEQAISSASSAARQAENIASEARQNVSRLEENEQKWRSQAETLGQAGLLLERWQGEMNRMAEMEADLFSIRTLALEMNKQKQAADKARQEYADASRIYEQKNKEYENSRRIFLNAQAGFIAKEQLRPGQPCPVCGSLHHPRPCQLEEDHQNLSRDELDVLGEEVNSLRSRQEDTASASRSAAALFQEKENTLTGEMEKLQRKLAENVPEGAEIPEKLTIGQAEKILLERKQSLSQKEKGLKEDVETLKRLQSRLQGIETEKSELRTAAETAAQKLTEAKALFASCQALRDSLDASREYETEAEAKMALAEAKERKSHAEQSSSRAEAAGQKAKSDLENAQTLIRRYRTELPGQEKERGERKKAYERAMQEKALTESQWKEQTETRERTETARLQEIIDAYNRKKAAAESRRDSAKKETGRKKQPVPEELEAARGQAKARLDEAQKAQDREKGYYRADTGVYQALKPVMEERKKVMDEHRRLDELYNLLAGNVTGSRMDIETFVQRYYLERILYAANRRFQDMTGGQFELRMFDIEKAGKGKNRGLDLMVYSTVTGKEREVRTLSGGESFMAALSLALGMADQIRAGSASVNLDVMFIDEGFGSLDEHSRDKAVRVLQNMAGDSRMIGIISHVSELKQEIEDQLVVQKDEEGSHVRWQIS